MKEKKRICTCSTLFFLISKKQICRCSTLFCLSLPLFCTTTMPFCTTKTSNFLVNIIFMEELSYVLIKDIVSCVHVYFYFFIAAHFYLAGRSLLAASISHFLSSGMKFSCFLPTKFVSFVFNHSLCYPRECKYQK